MKKKLIFIPLDYHLNPHQDWFEELQKYFDAEYFKSYTNGVCIGYDYVFAQAGAVDRNVLQILKQNNGCKIIIWTGDARDEVMQHVSAYAGIADLCLLAVGIGQKKMYESVMHCPVGFMQQGVFNSFFIEPKFETEKDIVFIGNRYDHFKGANERNSLIDLLKEEFNDMKIYGSGYEDAEPIQYERSAEIYNNAFVSISHACFNNIDGYFSNRTPDIMASGGLCLMRYAEGAERFFTDGKDVLFYRTYEEAIHIIKKLTPEQRYRIATNGHNLAKANHTFEHRAFEILDAINTYL